MNGSLTLNSGVFTAPATLNVAGNWTNNAGTAGFNANGGTVVLTGAGTDSQTISGSNNFYNLTADTSAGSAAETLYFAAGSTQAIAGYLTLKGNSTNKLLLRSTSTGTQWNITPTVLLLQISGP